MAAAALGNLEARPRHPSPDNTWTPGRSLQRWPGPCVCRPRAGPLCWVTILACGLLWEAPGDGATDALKAPTQVPRDARETALQLGLCVPGLPWHLLTPWGRETAMGDMPERLGSWCPCSLWAASQSAGRGRAHGALPLGSHRDAGLSLPASQIHGGTLSCVPGLKSKSGVHHGSQVPPHWAECWAAPRHAGLPVPPPPAPGLARDGGPRPQTSTCVCARVYVCVHVGVCALSPPRGWAFPCEPGPCFLPGEVQPRRGLGSPVPSTSSAPWFGGPGGAGHREASWPLKRSVSSLLSVSGGDVLVTLTVPGGPGDNFASGRSGRAGTGASQVSSQETERKPGVHGAAGVGGPVRGWRGQRDKGAGLGRGSAGSGVESPCVLAVPGNGPDVSPVSAELTRALCHVPWSLKTCAPAGGLLSRTASANPGSGSVGP